MKNLCFLILAFIYSFTIKSQEISNSDSVRIVWGKDIKLKWSDFSGKVIQNEIGLKKAIACTEIVMNADINVDEVPEFKIETYFVKNCSWTITNSLEMLEHEQLHFDIAELFSRKIRKKFYELKNEKIKNVDIYINVFNEIKKEEVLFQKKYDSEVYFNKEKQREWIMNVGKLLKDLEEFGAWNVR